MRSKRTLEELLTELDSQLRISAVNAHKAVLEVFAKTEATQIGDIHIPAEALMPRELLEPKKIVLEVDCTMYDDHVELTRNHLFASNGSKAKLIIEWESTAAPEATSLVRTKAEIKMAKEL